MCVSYNSCGAGKDPGPPPHLLFSNLPRNRQYRHTPCPALLLLFVVCCCGTGRTRRSGPSLPAGVQTPAPPDRRRPSEVPCRHQSIRLGTFLVDWVPSEGRGRGGTGDRWAQRPLVRLPRHPPPSTASAIEVPLLPASGSRPFSSIVKWDRTPTATQPKE